MLALLIGLGVSAGWQTVLLYLDQATGAALGAAAAAATGPGATTPVSDFVDPVFGRPLAFYLFDLPFYRFATDLLGNILDALILLTGAAYLVLARRSMALPHGRRWAWHVGILVALRIGIGAIGFQLDKFSLAFSQRAYPYPSGVDATDAAVRIPAADVLTVLTDRGRGRGLPGHRASPVRMGRHRVRGVARRWPSRPPCWRSSTRRCS